jgi:hypothetical protein
MPAADHDALVLARVARLGIVPSIATMAGDVGLSIGSVHAAYRRLGLRSARQSRASCEIRARVAPATRARLARLAAARGLSVSRYTGLVLDRIERGVAHRVQIPTPDGD